MKLHWPKDGSNRFLKFIYTFDLTGWAWFKFSHSVSRTTHWVSRNFLPLIFLGMWILIMLFINFNKRVADNAKAAKDTTAVTQQIIKNQDKTLQAIKDLATDNKLTSKQLGDTIICMLQVPIAQRTTDVQEKCRKQAQNITLSPDPSTQTKSKPTDNTNNNTQNQSSNQNSNTGGQGDQANNPQPVEVFGVPVCIPLTGVCVTR